MFILEESKSGPLTIKYNNIYIHSKYDPIQEANVFAKANITNDDRNVIVVYGLGLGYHIKALAKLMNYKATLYVFEYNEQMVEFCKKVNKSVFENSRIKIIYGEKHYFFSIFSQVLRKVNNLIIHRTSLETIKSSNPLLYNLINDFNIMKQYEKIDVESIEKYENNYMHNIKLNCDNIDILLKKLNNINMPVLIAAAGPSLEIEIQKLKKYRNMFFIICVGSAFRTLIDNDIIPDIVVIIDPNSIVKYQFENLECYNVPLCFSASASKEAVDIYKGPRYIFNTEDDEENIETCGTVAIAAVNIAVRIKAKEILLLGQDLGFINNQSHVAGFEKNYELCGLKDDFYERLKRVKIKGVYGTEIETTQIYITFKNRLEAVIRKNENIKFVNISKGACIDGTVFMEFKEYLKI